MNTREITHSNGIRIAAEGMTYRNAFRALDHLFFFEYVIINLNIEGINCWNPSFDVTPAELITGGLITEFGVFYPSELEARLKNRS